ncbi:hypothetical protein BD31_I1506 [Candidatus Nitrosopumilus salaria BD31]|uniref:Uncharacterized protein n=1 Tax=Candidatus Nitrosopumilus salarius BD31 TaxID=859350 RepID=I3D3N0_9ARCH|nr:hypothetical protein [Candidatus Nitrosopumilus salaria]EIJ66323.1 hypothetical protein BD31_I1506 [Candidatus Nitrosopumilus salaria BD31]
MAKKEPVSVLWQSIFMIIPIFDLYASYRVEKLRKYLLFIIIYYSITAVILLLLFPIDDKSLNSESSLLGNDFDDDGKIGWGVELIAIGISIILIRKWSRQWNEQFSENKMDDEVK